MARTMRAMVATEQGSVDDVRRMDVPVPEPKRGEVRVKVHAAAVNAADYKVVMGMSGYRFIHRRVFPLHLGYDVSGVVDAIGDEVTAWKVGDSVFGHLAYHPLTRQGTFAEYVTLPESAVGRKPPDLSDETAAAAATAGLTALQALRDKGRLEEGGRVLVIGAAGGVGTLAIGIAKRLGAHVTAVCSADAIDFVRELGADEVVDRKQQDPMSLPGKFDVVFDTPVVHSYLQCRHLLTERGAYVATLPSQGVIAGALVTLVSSQRSALVAVASRRADLELLATFIQGGLAVPIDSRYPVREVGNAIERIARGDKRGRTVVDVVNGW